MSRNFIVARIPVAPTNGKEKVFPDLVDKKFFEYKLGKFKVYITEDLSPKKEELQALEKFLVDKDFDDIFYQRIYVYSLHTDSSRYKVSPNPGATTGRIS